MTQSVSTITWIVGAYFWIPLDVDGIDASINTQIMKTPHALLVNLADFDYEKI